MKRTLPLLLLAMVLPIQGLFAQAPGLATNMSIPRVEQPLYCTKHCDCNMLQPGYCLQGSCVHDDPELPIYCCDGDPPHYYQCPPGATCVSQDGDRGVCPEAGGYPCENACDCEPNHACINWSGWYKSCISPDNPFGVVVPPDEPTYCCTHPRCIYDYQRRDPEDPDSFSCLDPDTGTLSQTCDSETCSSSCDCPAGKSCVDLSTLDPSPGMLCTGVGTCVSDAIAETVLGYAASDILSCCRNAPQGERCESGWTPGGVALLERVVATGGSCGNGVCDEGEYPYTCADCFCGDGKCDTTEFGNCSDDCGTCGDRRCIGLETPKNCPFDCVAPVCGDGSCSFEELATCPEDCLVCSYSFNYSDCPSACGDGVCQRPVEDHVNCSQDCVEYPVTIDARVLLEGPYSSDGRMSDTGTTEMPVLQPFNTDPWNYPGSECLPVGNSSAVDWVLLELRSNPTPGSFLGRRSAILLEDGRIVDDGLGLPDRARFYSAGTGNPYLIVRHRNHVDAMSSEGLTGGAWDFTGGSAYGSAGLKELPDGYYAMWAGDANGDGFVQTLDFNTYIAQTTTGASGYQSADFNMDGAVDLLDFNLFVANTSEGASSQVP